MEGIAPKRQLSARHVPIRWQNPFQYSFEKEATQWHQSEVRTEGQCRQCLIGTGWDRLGQVGTGWDMLRHVETC